ncbi:hypothetical protein NHG32_07085 [Aerococcaceae bacterium NML191219]|nr:hypothetical protein [Aerococcaceae bacterium NML191219]
METIRAKIRNCQSVSEYDRDIRPLLDKMYKRFDLSDENKSAISSEAMRKYKSLKRRGKK